ncbi:hypothetical protein AKG11_29290 [Shinella sp. SUS2]|nr:hypothetical protein AKG11_29290 [Shinella sp. SUS2]KOC72244.1 hypothetical protein AKG10_28465 [Shinella sp. GWS1]
MIRFSDTLISPIRKASRMAYRAVVHPTPARAAISGRDIFDLPRSITARAMTESTASLLIVNLPAMQVGMMQFLASERRRTQDAARLSAGIDGRR